MSDFDLMVGKAVRYFVHEGAPLLHFMKWSQEDKEGIIAYPLRGVLGDDCYKGSVSNGFECLGSGQVLHALWPWGNLLFCRFVSP